MIEPDVGVTVKSPELVAVPPGASTEIGPVVAPEGTVAVICASPSTVKLPATLVPLNRTSVAPVKPDPVIVTEVPTGPELGENPVMVGGDGAVTVKSPELVAVPPGATTEIGPVVAPEGTVAVICASPSTVKLPATLVPLNRTSVAPAKPDPVIVTEVPTGPELGENPVMVGGAGGTVGRNSLCQYSVLPTIEASTTVPLAAVVTCLVELGSSAEPPPFTHGTNPPLLKPGDVKELSQTSISPFLAAQTQIVFWLGLRTVIG